MVTKIFKIISMACIVFVLDRTDLDKSSASTVLKGLANTDTSILVSILSAWQPVTWLMWFSSVPSVQTQTYVVEMSREGHMYHKNRFAVAYSLGNLREILAMCSLLFVPRPPFMVVQLSLFALGIIPCYFKHLIIWKN